MDARPMMLWQNDSDAPDIGPLYEPDPVLFSFDAPGWLVVGGLLLVLVAVLAVWLALRYRQRAYRRLGLRQLEALSSPNDVDQVYQINRVLKVVAMKTYGREQVASLAGEDWAAFLRRTGMKQQAAEPLSSHYAPSASTGESRTGELLLAAKTWIQRHA